MCASLRPLIKSGSGMKPSGFRYLAAFPPVAEAAYAGRGDRADLADHRRVACAHAAHLDGEHLAGEQVGLCVSH